MAASPDPSPDAALGELFAFAAKQQSEATAPTQFRVLIRSSNWLGDAVMTVPAIRAIKRARPGTCVTMLTPEKLADVWKLIPEVDEVISFPAPEGRGLVRTWNGTRQIFKVAGLVRDRGFDVAVIFPNSLRTGLEAWLAKIPRRIGYAGHAPRGMFLNEIVPVEKYSEENPATEPPPHQVHRYLKLAKLIGAVIDGERDLGFRIAKREASSPVRVAVCAGAEYGAAKRWLPDRFAEVIRNISESTACHWHLVGTAKDHPVAAEIVTLAGNASNVENQCGSTTLAELIEVLKKCHLLVTNDTGTMHLAALLGVRTVAIFGSTEPQLTGPLGSGHTVLRERVACSPCFLRECPIDFRCMKAIEPATVIGAVRTALGLKTTDAGK